MSAAVDRLRAALESHGCEPREKGSGYSFRCPLRENHKHGDRNPSGWLHAVSSAKKQGAGLSCYACGDGSDVRILDLLDLSIADLYDEPATGNGNGHRGNGQAQASRPIDKKAEPKARPLRGGGRPAWPFRLLPSTMRRVPALAVTGPPPWWVIARRTEMTKAEAFKDAAHRARSTGRASTVWWLAEGQFAVTEHEMGDEQHDDRYYGRVAPDGTMALSPRRKRRQMTMNEYRAYYYNRPAVEAGRRPGPDVMDEMKVVDGNREFRGTANNVSRALAMVEEIGPGLEPRVECCGKTFCQAPFYSSGTEPRPLLSDQANLWWGLLQHRAEEHGDAFDQAEFDSATLAEAEV